MSRDAKKGAPARRVVAVFRGTVQGVGFRFTTRSVARGFAVTGTVRNRVDGSVEVVAEGAEEDLRAFLAAVEAERRGDIRERTEHWGTAAGEFWDFRIVL